MIIRPPQVNPFFQQANPLFFSPYTFGQNQLMLAQGSVFPQTDNFSQAGVPQIPTPQELARQFLRRQGGAGAFSPTGAAAPQASFPPVYQRAVSQLVLIRQDDSTFRIRGSNDEISMVPGNISIAAGGIAAAGTPPPVGPVTVTLYRVRNTPDAAIEEVFVVPANGQGHWRPLTSINDANTKTRIKDLAVLARTQRLLPREGGTGIQAGAGANPAHGVYRIIGNRILWTGRTPEGRNERLIFANDDGAVRRYIEFDGTGNPITNPLVTAINPANLAEVRVLDRALPNLQVSNQTRYYTTSDRTIRVYNPTTGRWGHPQLTINGAAIDWPAAGLDSWCSGVFSDGTLRYANSNSEQREDSMVLLPNGDIIMLNTAGNKYYRSVYNRATRRWGDWGAGINIPASGDIRTAADRTLASRTARSWAAAPAAP